MDFVCYDDLNEFGAETTSPLEELEQDNYHRLITPRGRNLDDPDGGIGLEDMLSGPYDPATGAKIEGELRKDPRNAVVRALVTEIAADSYRIQIDIETDDDELLRLAVNVGADGVTRV